MLQFCWKMLSKPMYTLLYVIFGMFPDPEQMQKCEDIRNRCGFQNFGIPN